MTPGPETIAEVLAAHAAGRAPGDTVRAAYARVRAHGDEAVFLALRPEAEAVAAAEALPPGGALRGVPFAVKDNLDAAGLPTTAACPAFAYTPAVSAAVVRRLEAAGAVLIGKTNLDQFATGLVGTRSPYGVPRNALRAELVPGGSSSGSAVAVAAGLVPFALGTDTAGSGRVPAALNGIVGLKPTRGLLSTRGVVPACRSLDCVSILALTVDDADAVLRVAAGFDPADPFSRALTPAPLSGPPPHLRVAVPREADLTFTDAASRDAFAADLAALAALGAATRGIDLAPFLAAARLLYEGPWVAERYAAVRSLIETNPDALHPITRRVIEAARAFSAADAFEASYALAALRREAEAALAGYDLLAVPTIPGPLTLEALAGDPLGANAGLGTYTNFVNLLDLAALTVPTAARADGLPGSLTLIGRAGSEGMLGGIGRELQAWGGLSPGATGLAPPAPAALPRGAGEGWIELAVVGAHLSGLPLNRELTDLSAAYLREARTTPDYRLHALPGTTPPKPGLLRVPAGTGAAIAVEVWALAPAAFGTFASRIPAPLGLGTLTLDDGTTPKGFVCEVEGVRGAEDVSGFGGWRAYVAAR